VDTIFQRLAGLREFLVQSTISRFLGRVSRGLTAQLHGVGLHLLLSVRQGFRAFSRLTLDLDKPCQCGLWGSAEGQDGL